MARTSVRNASGVRKSGEFFRVHATGTGRERYTLNPGTPPQGIRFANLFYADMARQSLRRLPAIEGCRRIPAGTRFQVDLVPAHSVIWLFLVDELHAAIDPIYNEAVKREIDMIADNHPARRAEVSSTWPRPYSPSSDQPSGYGRTKAQMLETFGTIVTDLGNTVPADVELLYHFCYGDSDHRHVVEPTDMGDMVELANRVSRSIRRPVALIHAGAAQSQHDDGYSGRSGGWRCGRKPSCASGSCITPTASPAR